MEQTTEQLLEEIVETITKMESTTIVSYIVDLKNTIVIQEKRIKDLEKANMILKHRLVDDIFEEGFLANQDGCSLEDCPYDEGTDGEFGWKKGWREAPKEQDELS